MKRLLTRIMVSIRKPIFHFFFIYLFAQTNVKKHATVYIVSSNFSTTAAMRWSLSKRTASVAYW